MNELLKLNPGEVVGIGAVATALSLIWAYVVYKIVASHRKDYTSLTNKVIEVVQQNAKMSEALAQVTRENTDATRQSKDAISQLMIQLIKTDIRSTNRRTKK